MSALTRRQCPPGATVAPRAATLDDASEIGFYIFPGETEPRIASCDYQTTSSHYWTSVGNAGVCAMTEDESSRGTWTTFFYKGDRCNGISAVGHYYGLAGDITANVNVNFTCAHTCATITIFEASPSVGPSLSWIGCPEMLALPYDVHTVYSQPPVITTESSSTSASTRTTISGPRETGAPEASFTLGSSNTSNDSNTSNSPNASVIVGAIVGSIAGVALLLLAFVLGWRYASRKGAASAARQLATTQPATSQPPPPQPYEKPELDGTKVEPATTTVANPAAPYNPVQQQAVAWNQNQVAWGHQSIYGQAGYPSGVAPISPVESQPSTGTAPYELDSSSSYLGQQRQSMAPEQLAQQPAQQPIPQPMQQPRQ